MENETNKKSKFIALNGGAIVKVKLNDYQLYTLARNRGRIDRPTEEEKQNIIANKMDKDGYINLSLWELAHDLGRNMPNEILINEDDLRKQQTKQVDAGREM